MWMWIFSLLWINMAEAVRVKDISDIYGMRDNSLIGYGLVTGLQRTGDTMRNEATIQTLSKRLQGLGVTLTADQIRSRNVAVVMVTATMPSTARPGQKLDVTVSSAGDAMSLQGGVLQLTQLLAPNGDAYAIAQGPLAIGGFSIEAAGAVAQRNHTTVGRVPMGATVERENDNRLKLLQQSQIDFLLREPDFSTAQAMVTAINAAGYGDIAIAVDSTAIAVKIPEDNRKNVVEFLSVLESVDVQIDAPSKVVVNERTGTIVMGADVRISQVSVAHGGVSIEVQSSNTVSQPNALSGGQTVQTQNAQVNSSEAAGQLQFVGGEVTIQELVTALNALGVKPRDMIQILVTIKAAGALNAELEIL